MATGRATHIFAADQTNDLILNPASVGLPERERIATPFEVKVHARLNADVINGIPGPAFDQATFTAGVILFLLGVAADVADGLARARGAIQSGAAQRRLELVRSYDAS